MATEVFAVVCAWCNRIVAGAPNSPVTHTICPSCLEWTITHRSFEIEDGAPSDIGHLPLPPDYFGDAFKH